MTSNELGFADPPAGIRQLFVLAPDCCATALLHSCLRLEVDLVVVGGRNDHFHPLAK